MRTIYSIQFSQRFSGQLVKQNMQKSMYNFLFEITFFASLYLIVLFHRSLSYRFYVAIFGKL